jgi:integrase
LFVRLQGDPMRGKQAKTLSDNNLDDLLLFAETGRHPLRNKVIVLLSAKSGLRAGEIAHLTWAMVTDATGAISTALELSDAAAKKGSGRVIPLHEDLRTALAEWRLATNSAGPVIVSERGGPMRPESVVVWLPMRIGHSALPGALRIQGAGPSSRGRQGLFIALADPCETFSSWLAIGLFKQLSGTSMAIPTPSASSSH